VLHGRNALQIRDIAFGELEMVNEFEAFFQTGKDCVFSAKGILA
jgi:hypothetical protein